MTAKLSVIFYILLCLEVGIVLTVLPWYAPFGLGEWRDNFFLYYAATRTGLKGLQYAVSSGWVRGAVSGLGLLNIGIAVWEIVHFRRTVDALATVPAKTAAPQKDVAQPPDADNLPDNERDDDTRQQSGQ